MTNPAAELVGLISTWNLQNSTPLVARGGVWPGDTSFWRGQGHALELLHQTDLALQSLKASGLDVSSWEDHLPSWYRCIFSVDFPWGATGNAEIIPAADMNMLRALATMLEASPVGAILNADQRRTLAQCVEDAIVQLAGLDSELSAAEKNYVYQLLNSLRDVLEGKAVFGAVELRAIIDQLIGTLMNLGAQLQEFDGDDSRSNAVFGIVAKIVSITRMITYDLAAVAAIASGTIDTMKAISGTP